MPFKDANNSGFKNDISAVYANGITVGISDTSFGWLHITLRTFNKEKTSLKINGLIKHNLTNPLTNPPAAIKQVQVKSRI